MQTEFVEYQLNNLTMQSFVARNTSTTLQPIVLIVHDWSGNREHMHERAKYFAEQDFVGFSVDLYGKDRRGSDTDKSINQQLMGEVMHNRAVIVQRLQAALDVARKLPNVDTKKVLVLGFCFGGLCALDFARSGADVTAVVSIHGLFVKPETTHSPKITAKILALHGYADKMVTPNLLAEFQEELTSRGADWQLHVFGNAMHAFTNPKAHDDEFGLKFNAAADTMTWAIVKSYTEAIFS